MADIVARLRTWDDIYRHGARPGGDLLNEAADEIERLRHELRAEAIAREIHMREIQRLFGEVLQIMQKHAGEGDETRPVE